MTNILQVEAREIKDSLLEMGHAMINLEVVQKVDKTDKKSRKANNKKKKVAVSYAARINNYSLYLRFALTFELILMRPGVVCTMPGIKKTDNAL